MTNKITLKQFCELLNSQDEWKLSNIDIIKENGWIDLTHENTNVCSNGDEKITINEKGSYEIVNQ
jgi:hypothetical protein